MEKINNVLELSFDKCAWIGKGVGWTSAQTDEV
jgi:hypothetical protein